LPEDLVGGDFDAVGVAGVSLAVADLLVQGVTLALVAAVAHGPGLLDRRLRL
jgi:hypothetical protein